MREKSEKQKVSTTGYLLTEQFTLHLVFPCAWFAITERFQKLESIEQLTDHLKWTCHRVNKVTSWQEVKHLTSTCHKTGRGAPLLKVASHGHKAEEIISSIAASKHLDLINKKFSSYVNISEVSGENAYRLVQIGWPETCHSVEPSRRKVMTVWSTQGQKYTCQVLDNIKFSTQL